MTSLTIHPCKCGAEPKLIYTQRYVYGTKSKIQVRCPKCGTRNYPRSDAGKAVLNWNARFE